MDKSIIPIMITKDFNPIFLEIPKTEYEEAISSSVSTIFSNFRNNYMINIIPQILKMNNASSIIFKICRKVITNYFNENTTEKDIEGYLIQYIKESFNDKIGIDDLDKEMGIEGFIFNRLRDEFKKLEEKINDFESQVLEMI